MDWLFAVDYSYALSQWLFIKCLGLVYLIAFWSLLIQVKGLYGSKGISPIHELLNRIKQFTDKERYYHVPSIFWVYSSDRFLQLVAGFGILASLCVVLGVLSVLFLFVLWVCYLSFLVVGSEFLSFQWDILLLEIGFISIFFAMVTPPPPAIVFLLWFLLFRFMFSSGITKLFWGSYDWRDLTAMEVHYETQPLPTRFGYYLHHQPLWFAKLTTLGVFFWN